MNLNTLIKKLNNNNISPVYMLYSSDSGDLNNVVNLLKKCIFKDNQSDIITLFSKESDFLENFINQYTHCTLFSNKRLFVIKSVEDAEDLKGRGNVKNIDIFLETISNNIDDTYLLIQTKENYNYPKISLIKKLKESTTPIEVTELTKYNAKNWIENYLKNFKVEIHADAVIRMIEYTGLSKEKFKSELDKLILFLGNRTEITVEDIEKMVENSSKSQYYELADALIKRDKENAFKIFKNYLNTNIDLSGLIGIFSVLRNTVVLFFYYKKAIVEFNAPSIKQFKTISSKFNPFNIKKFKNLNKTITIQNLKGMLKILLELDYRLKSSKKEEGILFCELAMFKICELNK